MAKRIRCIVEQTTTIFEDDGSIASSSYSARYQTEDADDAALAKWVDVEGPDLDNTRTVAAQRDQIEADARVAEGIAART